MALPAFANEGFVEKGHFAPVQQTRALRSPANREPTVSMHQQQADRRSERFDRPLPRRRAKKMPLMARIGIVGFGAVLGWSVPIAVATILVHG